MADKPQAGYDTSHHLIERKVLPPALQALQQELAKPENAKLSEAAQKGRDFEECLGIIAAQLDIALDGLYDVPDLCDLLVNAIRNKHLYVSNPHMRDQRLMNVELLEKEGTVELVEGKGTIVATGLPTSKGSHFCNWPACTEVVPNHLWGCKFHWFLLPAKFRVALYRTWQVAKDNKDGPVADKKYMEAFRKAKVWIAAKGVGFANQLKSEKENKYGS